MGIKVSRFEFDARNRAHFEDKFAERGIDENIIWEVLAGEPAFFENAPDRSGTHLMVGPSAQGRLYTIVVVEVDTGLHIWRPITGWPSTSKETRKWRGDD